MSEEHTEVYRCLPGWSKNVLDGSLFDQKREGAGLLLAKQTCVQPLKVSKAQETFCAQFRDRPLEGQVSKLLVDKRYPDCLNPGIIASQIAHLVLTTREWLI